VLAGVLLACSSTASALNPALDANQYAHTAWKIREGFAKGYIDAIAQTPDGYLWLGTEFGLLRFDGVRNVSWQPPPGEGLPSNWVRSLLVGHDGTLWIGTLKGLASWKGGKLTQYPRIARTSVDMLVEDRQGTVWAAGIEVPNGKLCAIESATGAVRCYGEDGMLDRYVASLLEDSSGNLWVGASNGLWRWKPGPPKRYAGLESPNYPSRLIEGDNHSLVIVTRAGLKHLVEERLGQYAVPGMGELRSGRALLRDREGGLWIGMAEGGLLHVHEGRTDAFAQSDGLSNDGILTLFEDREGSIWVATEGGLDRFREFAVSTISVKQGLSRAGVTSVLSAADGGVWFGTTHDLERWKDGRIDQYENVKPVWYLFQKDRGRFWIETDRHIGFFENGRFVPFSGVPGGVVRGMAVDVRGDVWIANQNQGLFRVRAESQVESTPWSELGHGDFASTVSADPVRGGVWLGFYNGGVVHFADGQIRSRYTAADGLGDGVVNDLKIETDGTVWAATEGGLSRVKGERVATLTSRNGLPCDGVQWMIEDDAHSWWLNTPCGLARVARSDLEVWASASDRGQSAVAAITVQVFDTFDGVASHASAGPRPGVAKSLDGKLWFLPFAGVSVVDPRHLPFNKIPPPVHIEQIIADRKTYDAFDTNGQVKLPPLIRDLEIDYTALSLVAADRNRFRVKLEGWDRDWQDLGNRRQAFYSNLPPRNYRFRVIASNNSGVWNETGASLDFAISPAYYQTTWFAIVSILATLALIWTLYQWRVRQVAYAYESRLQERVNERTRIARELHDTLLQSFHGLLFRFQAAANLLPDRPAEAKQKFESAIDQAAQAITEGRDAVQNLRSSSVDTHDLAVAIGTLGHELAAAQAARGDTRAPVVDVAVEGTPRSLHPILRDDIYRIAGEALRNAFRHAHARHIEVEIRYDDAQLQVRVRDDGRGIDPDILEEHREGHFGLPGMRERADVVGGQLNVWSQTGLGAEIELTIPAAAAYATPRPRGRFWWFVRRSGTPS
jgi:signal transduction histidine kinase/ligand-binding sensor domain-containing protein